MRKRDQRRIFQCPKSLQIDTTRNVGSRYIYDEKRRLLRYSGLVFEQWVPFFVPETALKCLRRAVCGILNADYAGIVSRYVRGLELMMVILGDVYSAFGFTVSEKKVELVYVPTPLRRQSQ